jgi:hypothetical protein
MSLLEAGLYEFPSNWFVENLCSNLTSHATDIPRWTEIPYELICKSSAFNSDMYIL